MKLNPWQNKSWKIKSEKKMNFTKGSKKIESEKKALIRG